MMSDLIESLKKARVITVKAAVCTCGKASKAQYFIHQPFCDEAAKRIAELQAENNRLWERNRALSEKTVSDRLNED